MAKPDNTRVTLDDAIPLRGVLKCHCGTPLTGAPSRGKSGKYFYYYKCKFSKHNNIGARKAHDQLLGAIHLMSLSNNDIKFITDESFSSMSGQMKENKGLLNSKKNELNKQTDLLMSVEEKWIKGEIGKETYDRWYKTYSSNIFDIQIEINRMGRNQENAFHILDKNIGMLTDMKYVYERADILGKREFVKQVFDNNLYYENGIYRTPSMIPMFSHKSQEMKEKGYLIYEKKGMIFQSSLKAES